MLSSTHMIAGAIAAQTVALATGHSIQEPMVWASMVVGALVATLPDIDQSHSFAGRKLFLFSWLLGILKVEHRTVTHSFLALAVVTAIGYALGMNFYWLLVVFYAYLSHIVLDMFTPAGVPVLWPKAIKLHLLPKALRMKTGGWGEWGFRILSFGGMLGLGTLLI